MSSRAKRVTGKQGDHEKTIGSKARKEDIQSVLKESTDQDTGKTSG
jgi:hypothetical protein